MKYNFLKAPDAPMELYDLSTDTSENNDLATKYPDVVKEMEAIFRTARAPSEVFTFDQGGYLQQPTADGEGE